MERTSPRIRATFSLRKCRSADSRDKGNKDKPREDIYSWHSSLGRTHCILAQTFRQHGNGAVTNQTIWSLVLCSLAQEAGGGSVIYFQPNNSGSLAILAAIRQPKESSPSLVCISDVCSDRLQRSCSYNGLRCTCRCNDLCDTNPCSLP
jgi:hypothetical protein